MKKIFSAILAATVVLSLVSCGKEEPEYLVDVDTNDTNLTELKLTGVEPEYLVDGDMSPSTDIYVVGGDDFQTDYDEVVSEEYIAKRFSEKRDIPYTDLTDSEWFEMYFEDFRDPDNPLQLSAGTFDDAVAISPIKSAYFNGSEYIDGTDGWEFPIAHENQCIGIISMTSMVDEAVGMPIGTSSQSYAKELNKVLEKGKAALFEVGSCYNIFAISEDNTVVNLTGNVEYKGDLTFEEVDKGYNVISADSFSTAVYPIT